MSQKMIIKINLSVLKSNISSNKMNRLDKLKAKMALKFRTIKNITIFYLEH